MGNNKIVKKELPVYEVIFKKGISDIKAINLTDKPLFGDFISITKE